MKTFKIKSHAKLNLALHVTGKSSKLHKLETIVTFVDLHDIIYIKTSNSRDHEISFTGKFSKNIKKDNTIIRLLRLLEKEKILKDKKFNIRVFKNIPQKSGMGGGSINASSIISFFISKKIIEIKNKQLIKLSKSIGSDVILGINPTNTILSSNGKIVAISARRNDGNGDNSGHVRVFEYKNNQWQQLGDDIDGENPEDYSGQSISLCLLSLQETKRKHFSFYRTQEYRTPASSKN